MPGRSTPAPRQRSEAAEALRGLVDAIMLVPAADTELRGNLTAMLSAAKDSKRSPDTGDLLVQIKVVAGARNPLIWTFHGPPHNLPAAEQDVTFANEHHFVVITNDLDFSAILAAGLLDGPSVVANPWSQASVFAGTPRISRHVGVTRGRTIGSRSPPFWCHCHASGPTYATLLAIRCARKCRRSQRAMLSYQRASGRCSWYDPA